MSLFIGNISTSTSKKSLTNLFKQFGECEVEFYRRFAYINYTKDSDAEQAQNAWNGKDLNGNKLKIEFSHRKPAGYSSSSSEIDPNEALPVKESKSSDSSSQIEVNPALNPSFLSVPLMLPTKTPPNTPNEEIQESSELIDEVLIKSNEKEKLLQEVIEEQPEVLQISYENILKAKKTVESEIENVEVMIEVEKIDLIEVEKVKDEVEVEELNKEIKVFQKGDLKKGIIEVQGVEEVKGMENDNDIDEIELGIEEPKIWVDRKEEEEEVNENKGIDGSGERIGKEEEKREAEEENDDGFERNEKMENEERIESFYIEERVDVEIKEEQAFMEIDCELGGDGDIVLDEEMKIELDYEDDENNPINSSIQPPPQTEVLKHPVAISHNPENPILPEPAILPNKPDSPKQHISPTQPKPKSDPIKPLESELQNPCQSDLQSKETPSKPSQSPSKPEKTSPFDLMKIEQRRTPFNDPFVVQEPEPEKEKPSLLLEIAKKSSEKSKTSRKVVNEETKVELSPIKRKIKMPRKVQKVNESLNETNDLKALTGNLHESEEVSNFLYKEKRIVDNEGKNKDKGFEELLIEKKKSEEKEKVKVELRRSRRGKKDEEALKEKVLDEGVEGRVDEKKVDEDLKERVDFKGEKVEKRLEDDPKPNPNLKLPFLKSLESLSIISNPPTESIPPSKIHLPPPKFHEDPSPPNQLSNFPPSNSLKFQYEVLDSETLTTSQTVFKILKQFKDFSNSLVRCCKCGKEIKLKSVPVHLTSKFHKESS